MNTNTGTPPKKPYATINLLSRKAKDKRQAGAMQQAISEGKSYAFKKKSNKPTTIMSGDNKPVTATGRGTEVSSGVMTKSETKPGKEYSLEVEKPNSAKEKKTFVPGDMQDSKVHNRKSYMGMSSMMKEHPDKTRKRIEEQEGMETKSKLGMLNDEDEKSVKSGYSSPTKTSHGGKEYYGTVKTEKTPAEKKTISFKSPDQTTVTKKPYVKVSPMKTAPQLADRDMGSKRGHVKWLDSKKETKGLTNMTNKKTSKSGWSGSQYKFNKIKRKA